jgi:basic membrane lipoprotein Med (substrate-binding protein (PBP1-ABC) superfamily)
MDFSRISRRHLLQGSAALALGSTIGGRAARAADTTIGFIYVGSRDDYGYNQAHAQGAAALKKLPGLVENAARRGAMVCGYHVNQSPLAPKAYLTGAEWNWEALYPKFVKMIAAGESIPNFYRGGLKEEIVKCSPYGEAVSAEARKHADDVKAKFLSAEGYTVFKGPLLDNKGKTVIAAGTDRGQKDGELEKMDYLVEGVIGATS